MIKLIAAIGLKGEIGEDDKMLWHIPEDFQHYKGKTLENILIVGRKTYNSLPLPALKGRTHIVVKSDNGKDINVPEGCDVHIAYSKEDAISLANELKNKDQDIYVIGGSEIYNIFIDDCDIAEITWVNDTFPNANKFFPIKKLISEFRVIGDQNYLTSKKGKEYKFTYYAK